MMYELLFQKQIRMFLVTSGFELSQSQNTSQLGSNVNEFQTQCTSKLLQRI